MATITDYASVSQALADFCHRQDIQAGLYTDYFIQGAIEKIQDDTLAANFGNGVMFQEAVFTPTAIGATGTIPVPTNWLSPKSFQISDGAGDEFTLIFKAAAWIYDQYPIRQAAGLPAYIARDNQVGGNVFIFGPYPDSSYTLQGTYYSEAAMLSTGNTTNWMVTNMPHMLHAAAMIGASAFLVDDAAIQRWTTLYEGRLASFVLRDKAERWASSTMQIECG